jgi:putative nucleotidyltransferase with HDIG domain
MSETATEQRVRPHESPGRPLGAGGRRLAAAFDTVSRLPALGEARDRLVNLLRHDSASPGELAEAVEVDTGLAIAVLQAANNDAGPRERAGSVVRAIEELSTGRIAALATAVETYDLLGPPGSGAERYERFRRHALAVRLAAERVGERAQLEDLDELAAAALLHDIGRLVLGELYGNEMLMPLGPEESPDERARRERREYGIDHALVGAVLLRRWGLPAPVAAAVERHHSPRAEGTAAALRLADLIVHHAAGAKVPPSALRETGAKLGLSESTVRSLLFEFPHSGSGRRRASEPCPLSRRELDALRGLAEGKVYKQIAAELDLSVSTVRTHLHNVYRKVGAVDRAQAVLIAREKGWI